jgi:hypothetical protein
VGCPYEYERQIHYDDELSYVRRYRRHPGHDVGEAHDPEIVIGDVTDLMSKDAYQLAPIQGSQQSVTYGDYWISPATHRKGIRKRTRDIV